MTVGQGLLVTLVLGSFVEIFVNSCFFFGGRGRAGSHSFSELHDVADPVYVFHYVKGSDNHCYTTLEPQ